MTAMLEKRGPERTGMWRDGSAALGHTLLATTPELQFERQPFTHPETGCLITADVRLDNRDELSDALGLGERVPSVGDAELILAAYLKWGDQCPIRLLGDFAFAIWDPRKQQLFCARDHFGLRPFYYHHAAGKRFAFGSDARAILVLPQVPYEINKGRVADFLVPQLQWIDYTSTFYEGVHRLPPGHKATVSSTRLEIAEYWRSEPVSDPGPRSDEEYAEGFLEVFTQAIECRLRAPSGAVGSMLSGGMDSGSVVAVGKDILSASDGRPLPTYSGVQYRDSDCEESRGIYAALTMPSISPVLVHPDAQQDRFEALMSDIEEPFDGEFTILKAIYLTARDQGQSVMLDGAGGDVVLGEGSYIARLIRHGQLKRAVSEIKGEIRYWGGSSLGAELLRHARAAMVPEFVKKPLRPFMDRHRIETYLRESMISPEFAAEVDIPGRFERMRQIFARGWTDDYAAERCNAILPNMTGGRERYARLAAGAATEARDPFLDKRVVDYCSRLPGHMRMNGGWPKILLRELMQDRLPEAVCWARRKPHIGWLFNKHVAKLAFKRGLLNVSMLKNDLEGYVDSTALQNAWREFLDNPHPQPIHSAFVLSTWLRESENRPVVPGPKFR